MTGKLKLASIMLKLKRYTIINKIPKMNLNDAIVDIVDFPKKGIIFKDISQLYQNPLLFNMVIEELKSKVIPLQPDFIAGIEARGFIIGSALSYALNIGFLPLRKRNKLPGDVLSIDYKLEYGLDRLEIQKNSVQPGKRVLVVDDILATGGTAKAAGDLIEKSEAMLLGYCFILEIKSLNGSFKLNKEVSKLSILDCN